MPNGSSRPPAAPPIYAPSHPRNAPGRRPLALSVAAAVALALAAPSAAVARRPAQRRPERGARGFVVLSGERVRVRWTDGDSFRIEGGPLAGRAARLAGVNALEAYGPVHRLPGITPEALHALALRTAPLAAAGEWRCEREGRRDRYGRLLVSCPDAAEALVRAGHALVFAVDGPADPRLLAAQRRAQAERAGMWAGGAPPLVPTGLHSADEEDFGPRGAYDRVVDTRSGVAAARTHSRRYAPCEEVCVGEGAGRACMTYVPFERRYRQRPSCLR